MANDDPIRFTLSDNTLVIVRKVTNIKYDFELILPNGNRKTFIWLLNGSNEYADRKGKTDVLISEAVQQYKTILNN